MNLSPNILLSRLGSARGASAVHKVAFVTVVPGGTSPFDSGPGHSSVGPFLLTRSLTFLILVYVGYL